MKYYWTILSFLYFILPGPQLLAADLTEGSTPETDKDYKKYIVNNAPSENAYVAVQRLAERYIINKQWDSAATIFKGYKPLFPGMEEKFDKTIALLEAPEENLVITELGPEINTPDHEYHPNPSADGTKLFFNRVKNTNEDIYISDVKVDENGKYIIGKAKSLGSYINTGRNEAVMSVSPDLKQLIIFGNYPNSYGNGDLFFTENHKGFWTSIFHFPRPVNTKYFESDGQLLQDGNVILFASDRPGGIGGKHFKGSPYHGDNSGNVDLYVCIKDSLGKWQEPVNLGITINTPYTERTPFLHPDGKTLYFSSDGHYGLGRSDIFVSTRLSDSSWAEWSEPVNLGKQINTVYKDISYKVSTDGELAYFAKASENGDFNIYTITVPHKVRPGNVVEVHGIVTDEEQMPIEADISVMDNDSTVVSETKSDEETGEYSFHVLEGREYIIDIEKENYFSEILTLDLDEDIIPPVINRVDTIKMVFDTAQFKAMELKRIRFHAEGDLVDTASFAELNRLANILKKNKGFKVSVYVHPEGRGSPEFNNFVLAMRRKNLIKYLNEAGVSDNQLVILSKLPPDVEPENSYAWALVRPYE